MGGYICNKSHFPDRGYYTNIWKTELNTETPNTMITIEAEKIWMHIFLWRYTDYIQRVHETVLQHSLVIREMQIKVTTKK